MEQPIHTLTALFDQMGLNSTPTAIERFIIDHKPLRGEVALHEARFWNSAQSTFLKQMKDEDADWAEIIDELDVSLR